MKHLLRVLSSNKKAVVFMIFLNVFFLLGVLLTMRGDAVSSEAISPENTSKLQVPKDSETEMKKWSESIETYGAQEAYSRFKQEVSTVSLGSQHEMAHLFGIVLYDKVGLPGVGICDGSFAFGCYHSFSAEAMGIYGVEIANELDQECVKKWGDKALPCAHGIGHGLLVSLGNKQLSKALEICSGLSWKGPVGGCSSGVFMEYNHNTAHSSGRSNPRKLDSSDPYAPCSTLPEEFRQGCYFELPDWWLSVYNRNFEKVGLLCLGIENELDRYSCFRGAGNTLAASTLYHVEHTAKACLKMPGKENQSLCIESAAMVYLSRENGTPGALRLCGTLNSSDRERCLNRLTQSAFFDKSSNNNE